MPWLISYQYSARFKYANGTRGNAPADTIEPSDVPPGIFFLQSREKLIELEDSPPDPLAMPARADEILRIYSAVEIDDATYKTLCEIV